MTIVTDFEAWLEQADPDDHEEVYALHQAVEVGGDYGFYKCTASADGPQWFVKASHVEDTLMLSTSAAKASFLSLIEKRYAGGDHDIESWYGYQRAMSKDD